MSEEWSALVREAIQAMDASEPVHALTTVNRLVSALWEGRVDGADLSGLWDSYSNLLQRRGYFVSTPTERRAALDEIWTLGESFDLYELARSLAETDTARTDCLKLHPSRAFPELVPFSPSCPCARHPEPRQGG